MPRPKKDSKPLNINLDSKIYTALEKYCEEKGQTKTTAIERILAEKLKDYFNNQKIKERCDK